MLPSFSFFNFYVGPVPVQVWGLLAALGIIVALFMGRFWLKKRGEELELFWNLAFWVILSALVSSRIFYVLFQSEGIGFFGNGINWLARTGFMSTGGFFGAGLAILVYYKKVGAKIRPYLDAIAFAFPFGWFFGRLGCFLIHDHPGSLTKSLLAVNFVGGARWDLGLLEALLMVIIVIIFIRLDQKRRPWGFYPALLLMIYGAARFGLDFLRATDLPGADTRWLELTIAQYGAVLLFLGGVYWWRKSKSGRFA